MTKDLFAPTPARRPRSRAKRLASPRHMYSAPALEL